MTVRFLQISDCHVCVDPSRAEHGIDPNESLARVVRSLQARLPVDFVVVTGDLIGDDEPASYDVLRSLLAPLSCPIRLLVGNHDLRAGFWEKLGPPGSGRLRPASPRPGSRDRAQSATSLGLSQSSPSFASPAAETSDRSGLVPGDVSAEPYFYEFEVGDYRFLALDSQIPGEVPGRIDTRQMDWIEERISARPDAPTIVFVHHPPIETGIDWLDAHRISNGEELVGHLRRGNVQRIFFGHVHMPMALSTGSILCTSAPSTCYGFSDAVTAPQMIGLRPGYQVIEADEDGVRSHIEWV
jgi:Icc protein